MITETGIWSEDESEAHAFDYLLARYLGKTLPKDKLIIDFGCGLASYLGYFRDIGFQKLTGIDGYKLNAREFHNIYAHDLTTPLDLGRKGNVISLEVFEHIPQAFENVFIDNIIRHLDGQLIISVAIPGQEGLGHINCQSNEYVIEKLTSLGLKYDEYRTQQARQNVSPHCSYFKNTLMAFYNEII